MPTEDDVVTVLREIIDPHTDMNIYDMGLISDIVTTDDSVSLTFRPTSRWCPLGVHFALNIKRRLMALDGVRNADVRVIGHVHKDRIDEELSPS
ncbi:MAG: DUF59 domain-containing protein [Methanobacteriota archaeon]|nr:MAG: DUF59 domain-containing protein [Euryarchaeota archaeon]